ncbi:hypothetical protein FKM82_006431 [Ascaphus truei]
MCVPEGNGRYLFTSAISLKAFSCTALKLLSVMPFFRLKNESTVQSLLVFHLQHNFYNANLVSFPPNTADRIVATCACSVRIC